MENPMKNTRDYFNQEDYDRLVKEGVTEFAEYSSLPLPDDPDNKPNNSTATSPQTTQSPRPYTPPPIVNPNISPVPPPRGGISRRDFIWGSLVLGVAAIGGVAYFSRREQTPSVPTPAAKVAEAKPTFTSVPATQAPTATINPRSAEAATLPTWAPTFTSVPRPIETPRPIATISAREKLLDSLPPIYPTKENRPPGFSTMEQAQSILGQDYLGTEAVKKAFRINVRNVPVIPFDQAELYRARELGQFLILRTERAEDGGLMTVEKMQSLLQKEFQDTNRGQVIDRKRSATYYVNREVQPKWSLVSKDILAASTINHSNSDQSIHQSGLGGSNPNKVKLILTQTQASADYLKNTVYKNEPLPKSLNEALIEFENHKPDIIDFAVQQKSGWEGFGKLRNLKLNQLTRHSLSDLVYDLLVYEQNRNTRLLSDRFAWVSYEHTDLCFINVGPFNPSGLIIGLDWFLADDVKKAEHGVLLSR